MIEITVGILGAILFVFVARRFSLRSEVDCYAVLLLAIQVVYLLFALPTGDGTLIGIQAAALAGFAIPALLGRRRFPSLLGMAILAHGLWDALYLFAPAASPLGVTFLPPGYEELCIAFDLCAGTYALARSKDWRVALTG